MIPITIKNIQMILQNKSRCVKNHNLNQSMMVVIRHQAPAKTIWCRGWLMMMLVLMTPVMELFVISHLRIAKAVKLLPEEPFQGLLLVASTDQVLVHNLINYPWWTDPILNSPGYWEIRITSSQSKSEGFTRFPSMSLNLSPFAPLVAIPKISYISFRTPSVLFA